jgi:hypothetical protein
MSKIIQAAARRNPRSRSARREEQAIQRAVFQHFEKRGAPGVFAFHVPNGGYRRLVEAAILKGLGVIPGVPDVIAIKGGRVFALELKAPGGRRSPAQRAALSALERAGASIALAHSLDGALFWLELWGLLRGRASTTIAEAQHQEEWVQQLARQSGRVVWRDHDGRYAVTDERRVHIFFKDASLDRIEEFLGRTPDE